MSTGTSIIMFFKFPKAQKSAYNIFHPTKKVSGYPVTSSAPELCCNRCSNPLFSSLYT